MSMPYGPPQQVSPLIRGARFALLFAGIFYARIKQARYNSLEAAYREEQAKKKIIRDREKAIIKARIDKEEKEAVRQFETGEMFRTDNNPSQPSSPSEPSDSCKKGKK